MPLLLFWFIAIPGPLSLLARVLLLTILRDVVIWELGPEFPSKKRKKEERRKKKEERRKGEKKKRRKEEEEKKKWMNIICVAENEIKVKNSNEIKNWNKHGVVLYGKGNND